MVDISAKDVTERTDSDHSSIIVTKKIYEAITSQNVKKGDVLSVAQVAGIMAAKNTDQMIPMCHPLQLRGVDISFDWYFEEEHYELIIETFEIGRASCRERV